MGAKREDSRTERRSLLTGLRAQLEVELQGLRREEEHLVRQVRRAQEQLRYYERHLTELRHALGRTAPLQELARRFG
jgi:chromosome segregation ATPase